MYSLGILNNYQSLKIFIFHCELDHCFQGNYFLGNEKELAHGLAQQNPILLIAPHILSELLHLISFIPTQISSQNVKKVPPPPITGTGKRWISPVPSLKVEA